MATQRIDQFAAHLDQGVQKAVHENSAAGTDKRLSILTADYGDPNPLRKLAGAIKQHTIEHLDQYLEQAEAGLTRNGVQVHFASTTQDACEEVLSILRAGGARKVVKSKSMISEEIHLNDFLEKNEVESVETDLGEYIIQIDKDHPSHIVKPIIHKNRRDIAKSFEREGLGDYNDDPETITRRARVFLRKKYLEADAAITGANFIVAETGRLVLVTNEGNSRFCLAGTDIHIALVGIEKLVPRNVDLGIMLNLLARSATGQQLTVYTEMLDGPRREGRPSGPKEMHVIFVDNGRTDTLNSDIKEILRCIRCGACMNVCPVYRQASGHAYRSVYPGPLGAVLSPMLVGKNFAQLADLPKASSLCGACNEVCPVDIPIPDLLVKLRNRAKEEHLPSPGSPPMGPYALMATSPLMWKTAMQAGVVMNVLPMDKLPIPAIGEWLKVRTLPKWRGGKFRSWMKKRKKA
ncbi:LutB/LldF family L-lactate oxidation iron-sulfur protein [soil metagenome]